MEKYQKLVSLIILFAFFAAISFYIQKTTQILQGYVTEFVFSENFYIGTSKTLVLWAIDFVN